MKDLTDHDFGRLTVIDLAGLDGNGHYLWDCICSCGNQIRASTSDLTTGHTKSCGCWRTDRLVASAKARAVPVIAGSRFGMLVVLEGAGRNHRGRQMVRAVCDCGREAIAEWNNVRQGTTKSCGCQKSRGWRESLRVRMERRTS
jgi:hypothetical protein